MSTAGKRKRWEPLVMVSYKWNERGELTEEYNAYDEIKRFKYFYLYY